MRRVLFGLIAPALLVAGLALSAVPAAAVTATSTGSAIYSVVYTCTAGCTGDFGHSYSVTVDCAGMFTGTGVSQIDPATTETVTGRIFTDPSTKALSFEYTAVYTGVNPGYTIVASGTVDPAGALKGSASSSDKQTFTVAGTRVAFTAPQCFVSDDDQNGPQDSEQD